MLPLIENYSEHHREALLQFLYRHSQKYPGAQTPPVEFYTEHPVFAGGKNIFCAVDKKGSLLAYAPLFPVPVDNDSNPENPHVIWTVIMVDPYVENQELIKDLLLEQVYQRAQEIKDSLPERKVRLAVDCFFNHLTEMAYFLCRGFMITESRYQMVRSLSCPIPSIEYPLGIKFAKSRIELPAEQKNYLQAYNQAFPESPRSLESLQYFNGSDQEEFRTNIMAFDSQDKVVGNITVVGTKKEGREKAGLIQDVFVLPQWRGKKIAKCLMIQGLLYLKEKGITETYLEVLTQNENALGLYQALGYMILNSKPVLGVYI